MKLYHIHRRFTFYFSYQTAITKTGTQRGTAGYRNKCVKRMQDANYMTMMLAGNERLLSKIWSFSATCVTAAPDDTYRYTNCFLLLQQISSMVFKGGENRFYLSVDGHLPRFLSLAMMISVAINMIGKNLCVLTSDLLCI